MQIQKLADSVLDMLVSKNSGGGNSYDELRHRRANRARGSKQKLARGTSNEVSWMQTTY